MTLIFGYLSGLFWFLSSLAWIWSASTPIPIRQHPQGLPQSIQMFTGDAAEGGGLVINGIIPPEADEIIAYQKKSFFRNAIAAGTSAVAAIFACAAVGTAIQ